MVEFVLCWREVGRQDIPCTAVDDQAGSYAARLPLGFHIEGLAVTVSRKKGSSTAGRDHEVDFELVVIQFSPAI